MRPLHLHDSLSRSVQPLVPDELNAEGKPVLRFYACGPTVYSYAHIGNFRTFLVADLVVRTAKALGWDVRYVSNITDVGHLTEDDVADAGGEDKMAKALRSTEGEAFENVWDLARHYTDALIEDWQTLNLLEPTIRPRATEHMREQILAAQTLVENGHAYETDEGVYFHVPSFADYGKLSGNREAERLGAAGRDVVRDSAKRDPRDFALWKKDPGHLMQWHSPFESGKGAWGFPGWHLECSVMAQKYLGDTIDLHSGGEDLRFPHHECEIAQAEALTGKPFARHWMHVRYLQVEGEKMSKSVGNFLTVRDLTHSEKDGGRADWGAPIEPLALRFALISGYYGKPFNFTRKTLLDARKNVRRLQEALDAAHEQPTSRDNGQNRLDDPLGNAWNETLSAMVNDLNTPVAIAATLQGANEILAAHREGGLSKEEAEAATKFLGNVNDLLGIVEGEYEACAPVDQNDDLATTVDDLLAQRAAARTRGDFAEADRLRDEAEALGVEVMDNPEGTTWRVRIAP